MESPSHSPAPPERFDAAASNGHILDNTFSPGGPVMIEYFKRDRTYDYSQARRHQRYAVDFMVKVRGGDVRICDRALNLSEAGLAVITTAPLPPMTLVELSLELPHLREPIDVVGRVMWATQDSMGLRFEQIDPRVADCVDRLSRDSDRL